MVRKQNNWVCVSCRHYNVLYTSSSSSSSRCFLTIMAKWKLCVLHLLPLTVCFGITDSEVSHVKTIGSEPDVTEICTNSTQSIITLIVCKIRTERNRPEVCRLLYQYGKDFEHQCDSRFKLILENQTVFLQLDGLTPVDSGNYSCECSTPDGTSFQHLKVTVEEAADTSSSTQMPIPWVWIGVTIVLIITGGILGFVLRKKVTDEKLDSLRSATPGQSQCESSSCLDEDDPYTSLQHPAGDLYQSMSYSDCNKPTVHLDNQDMEGGESDIGCTDYENISTKESK
ncbi:uncharacterized protein LOC115577214 [Sparus aurata]|uniref:uncharacterized protein LOC115577214 n=1 Tax=Sparus aurata TaxID=8175 RepID=UPI0011C1494C|nr:uncharacterized protein LOC115577214 [Sparus aurata]